MASGIAANSNKQPRRGRQTNRKTATAQYNAKVMRILQDTLRKDPEADLAAALPSNYLRHLDTAKFITSTGICATPSPPDNDIRHYLDASQRAHAIFPLSSEVQALASDYENLASAVINLLGQSQVLYESDWAASVMVFRISENLVVKAANESCLITEHKNLSFLQACKPSFPAPIPHGLLRLGVHCFLFTSYIPGIDLEKAWPELDLTQKQDISNQLDVLLTDLRSIPFQRSTPLGGIESGVCSDLRRTRHISTKSIMSVEEFEDFVFHGSTNNTLYTRLLRSLMPKSTDVVFTHGDIRPANIMVKRDGRGVWRITALIDWELSGYYPDYWEAIKATNLLTPRDNFDWYEFIPKLISSSQYATPWLVDRLWDRSARNR